MGNRFGKGSVGGVGLWSASLPRDAAGCHDGGHCEFPPSPWLSKIDGHVGCMCVAHGAYEKSSDGLGCEQEAQPCCMVKVTKDVMDYAHTCVVDTGTMWVLGCCDTSP